MPVISESLLPGGAYPHTILYFGLGAVVLICCGVALRRTSRPQPSTSLPHHQDEKTQPLQSNVQDSWQEKRSLPLPPLATQPPPYASSPSPSAFPMQGSSFTYYASPVEMDMDMNPQSYFDEPFLTDEPSSYYSSSSATSEPAASSPFSYASSQPSLYSPRQQIPLSTKSWFESNPTSYSSYPSINPEPSSHSTSPPIFYDSPNSSYSSTGSLPRRRSYTKTTSTGGSVSGEILTGDTWRRHTRVFGGGVCKACEESEAKMKMVRMRGPVVELEGAGAVVTTSTP